LACVPGAKRMERFMKSSVPARQPLTIAEFSENCLRVSGLDF
jgi:hypothetical protein